MTRKKTTLNKSRGERGQTIILVAVCIVSLLAMAALAVDVVTLYVAKGEIQRAADAAALAGAKAFVESTVTTDPANVTLQNIAKTIACPDPPTCSSGYIAQTLTRNPVSGSPAVINPSSPSYDFDPVNHPGNPRITVSLQRTGLPIFFARIWSRNLASVSATATAEAYNASNSQNITGSVIPIAPRCVKPLLVHNQNHGAAAPTVPQFINIANGTIFAPGTVSSGGLIGREFVLSYGSCAVPVAIPSCVRYKPAVDVTTHNFCSSCAGGTPYEQSIECCDGSAYDVPHCGDAAAVAVHANQIGPNVTAPTETAMQCAIHATGPGLGNGQDALDTTNFLSSGDPMQIQAGAYSQGQLGVGSNAPITTSDSIMTLPIYDDSLPLPPGNTPPVTIVGFLQVFVNSTNPAAGGDLDVTILNVVGCGNTAGVAPAVSGGGTSAVPVRLITPGG